MQLDREPSTGTCKLLNAVAVTLALHCLKYLFKAIRLVIGLHKERKKTARNKSNVHVTEFPV